MNKRDQAERDSFINAASVICCLVVVGVMSVVLPKPSYSEMEKRDLAKLPALDLRTILSSEYAKGVSAYYSDSFPGRDAFVSMAGIIKSSAGIAYDGLTIHQDKFATLPPAVAPSKSSVRPNLTDEESSVQLPAAPGANPTEDVAPERAGPILVYNGKGYQIFGGLDSIGKQYADTVNSYSQTLGDTVQVYNLVVPSAIAFGLPEKHQNITAPEPPKIKNIYDNLDETVKHVDVYDLFNEHKDEYIFFGTDHHWTVYGAYLAYSEFIRAAGMEPVPLEDMTKKNLGYDFFGTYYSQTQDAKLLSYPDSVDYFIVNTPYTAQFYNRGAPFAPRQMSLYAEYAQGVNGYSVFLHGDFPLIKVTTDIKNGRKIAVVKESFGNAFSPFLVNHYEEVYIVDERYLEVGLVDLIRENNINELLILNNIFAAHTPYHINRLKQIMNQRYIPPAPPVAPPPMNPVPSTPPESETVPPIAPESDVQPTAPDPAISQSEPPTDNAGSIPLDASSSSNETVPPLESPSSAVEALAPAENPSSVGQDSEVVNENAPA